MDKITPISDVVWFQEGPGVRNTQYTTEGVKLLNVANLVDGEVDLSNTNRYISEEEAYGKYKHFLVDEGDLIIASSGIKVDYFDKKMGFIKEEHLPLCMNTSTIRFKTLNADMLDIRYFMYFLKSESFKQQLAVQITGSAQLNFGPSHLKKMSVKVVSIAQQKEIVHRLSEIDRLISYRQQQLIKLDELVKARFVELFGNIRDNEKNWEKVSLKSVAEVRGRVGWKGYKKDDLRESGPLVLGATHLTESGCIDLSSPVYLSREKYEESPEIMLQKNDLIFTQRGNTIGKVGLLENDIGEATINPCVLILRPLSINPIYFKTYFILDETKSDMWSLNAGSAQPMITQKGIGEYMLMLPPLKLQEQFAAFVEQTDKSKLAVQQSLEKLETLKKALMQKYFG